MVQAWSISVVYKRGDEERKGDGGRTEFGRRRVSSREKHEEGKVYALFIQRKIQYGTKIQISSALYSTNSHIYYINVVYPVGKKRELWDT